MAFVGNIIARCGADIRPMQKRLGDAQRNLSGFQKSANNSMAGIKTTMVAAAAVIGAAFVSIAASSVKMAMGVEASTQRIKYMFGGAAGDIMKWSEAQANAFNMSKEEAIKYAAVYGNLLATITKDNKTLFNYTTELLKASAIVPSVLLSMLS